MFHKILIANRGEIAVRVIKTCREMGIRTVAVYSEPDHNALHVREADEIYPIGPAAASESYLNIPRIIRVAQACGAQAIHPGYGFLSENPALAEACVQADITFIGPPARAMSLMGSKIAAKQLAQSVGAPVVPGYNGGDQDDATLFEQAQQIGFPLLIKASAGGGGKGMRTVSTIDDFLPQLAGARREAQAAFGDGTVFLERLILQPRHIEIQIFADAHGNVIHLGERECSIQRRHQKILEESPSVALTPALREEMGNAAIRIARAAGYVNAGTIEFMLDTEGQFYFLEMNTRLQVEHPVTELVTGLDLVRQQICIATGEPLTLTQKQVQQRGHAIEVRLYAEDPAQNFLPSPGPVALFVPPEGPGIRIDSGIATGDEITQYYDPMIAKLIVYGEDRPAAIARLQHALRQTTILGVTTNIPLLQSISSHHAFQQGLTHTSFLQEYGLLATQTTDPLPLEVAIAVGIATVVKREDAIDQSRFSVQQTTSNPWHTMGPWRMPGEARRVSFTYQDQEYTVALQPAGTNQQKWLVTVNEQPTEQVGYAYGRDGLLLLQRDHNIQRVYVTEQAGHLFIGLHGRAYRIRLRQPPDIAAAAHSHTGMHMQKHLTAPMAGTIVKVNVQDGEAVSANQVLLILSAMKMEHSIIAPYEGQVRHVHYQEGAVVPGGATLIEME